MRAVFTALLCVGLVALAGPATAEIESRSTDGFVLSHAAPAPVTPVRLDQLVGGLPHWWQGSHTYSGDAANLSVEATPGGCWCERLPDGTVFEHARIREIEADRVVLDAPLGPLNGIASRAVLTFATAADGAVTLRFEVEGEGVGAYAEPVEAVMAQAFGRMVAYAASRQVPQP